MRSELACLGEVSTNFAEVSFLHLNPVLVFDQRVRRSSQLELNGVYDDIFTILDGIIRRISNRVAFKKIVDKQRTTPLKQLLGQVVHNRVAGENRVAGDGKAEWQQEILAESKDRILGLVIWQELEVADRPVVELHGNQSNVAIFIEKGLVGIHLHLNPIAATERDGNDKGARVRVKLNPGHDDLLLAMKSLGRFSRRAVVPCAGGFLPPCQV